MPSLVTRPNPVPTPCIPKSAAVPPIPVPLIYVVRGRPGPLDRPALPSGHPDSWGAITDGTVLDHAAYPFPVFMGRTR